MKFDLKKIFLWGVFTFTFSACYQEVSIPITPDFSQTAQSYTVPATLNFSNLTNGAESYLWTFEGGTPVTSTLKSPSIVYKQAGTFTVKLEARNTDGIVQTLEKQVIIEDKLQIKIGFIIDGTAVAPAIVQFENSTSGATKYEWTFEGGNPVTSLEKAPKISFSMGGIHKISLKVSNNFSSISKDTTLVLGPDLASKFSWTTAPEDVEYEAPTTINLSNQSVGAISFKWTLTGVVSNSFTEKEPKITFTQAGTYMLTLEASNGKITQSFKKEIIIKPNKGYQFIQDLSMGISTAHGTVGSFYATSLRKTFKENDPITPSEASLIDLVYFGLNQDFTFNQFVSPNKTLEAGFDELKGGTFTKILNNQLLVSPANFENLDKPKLNDLVITNTKEITKFIPQPLPQVVLFENLNGKKGAILIKKQVNKGTDSYIVVDVKVLK